MAQFNKEELEFIKELVTDRLARNDQLDQNTDGQAQPLPSTVDLAIFLSKVGVLISDRRNQRRHGAPETPARPKHE